jgi:hypothetical protein
MTAVSQEPYSIVCMTTDAIPSVTMETSGNATGMAKGDGSGKDRAGPLQEFEGNPRERLKKAVRDQETIVVCGMGWENVELLDILAKSIPENHKMIELQPRFDSGLIIDKDDLPDHEVLVYCESLAEIAAAASNVAGDYLIVPNMRLRDLEVFQQDIAPNFKGGIILGVADAAAKFDEEVRSIADVLIQTIPRDQAPLGIGGVWARPGRDPLETIPAQDAGPHFAISTAGQISQAPASMLDADGDDIRRIRQQMVDFGDAAAARRWLLAQPREVAVVMAARAALRVLPIGLERLRYTSESLAAVVLPCFRAAATAWVADKLPTHGVALRDAAAHAADAARAASARAYRAREVAGAHAADAVADAARAAASAATADYKADRAYADAVATYTAADAAARAASAAAAGGSGAAASADAAFIESAGDAADRRRLAITLAGRPLWPDGTPDWAEEAWSRVRAVLLGTTGEDWEVWIELYDALLAGNAPPDPAVALAYTMPDDALWNEGPRVVNAEIKRLLAEAQSKAEAQKSPELPPEPDAEPIPPQGPGPHFTLSPDLRIALAPPAEIDAEGNNLARIRPLLLTIRQAAADLAGNINPNIHPELARIVAQYREALGSESEAVPWGLLFGLGVRLQNAGAAASRDILDRMREPLEDAAQEALESVLTLHGPLILASKEGRELFEDAERLRLTRDQQAAQREDAQTIAHGLKNSPELIELPAATVAEEAAATIGKGPHPERGTVFGRATFRNIATIILPAAVLATAGAVAGAYLGAGIGGVVGAGAGAVGTAVMRESERVKLAAKALGAGFDRLLEHGDQAMIDGLRRLTPFRRLVIALEEPLRRYAEMAQSRWMLRYIDFIVRTNSDGS